MFEVQDEGSQLMVLLANIKSKYEVLDLCAGKGTKTILMHNLIGGKGLFSVYDKSKERLKFFKKRADRLKIKNIDFYFSLKKLKKIFDLVVCDVPCSATGTWRRRPENLIWLNDQCLNNLIHTQYKILKNAAKFVKLEAGLYILPVHC